MGSITVQVVEAGFSNATKTYTVPDTHIDRLVAAYQIPANASVNGTASRAQVLNYWANQLIQVQTVGYILAYERAVAEAAADAGVSAITAT